MKHGENDQQITAHAIVDAKWKSMHAYPADIRHDFPKSSRRRAGAKERALDFRLEFPSEAGTLFLIPSVAPQRIQGTPDGGTTEPDSLSAGRRGEAFDAFPGNEVVGVRIVLQEACTKLCTVGLGKPHSGGFFRIDAIPDLFDQRETLLDVELVQPKLFQRFRHDSHATPSPGARQAMGGATPDCKAIQRTAGLLGHKRVRSTRFPTGHNL
jgi:hypothetical protein